jgi:hypothetical protein
VHQDAGVPETLVRFYPIRDFLAFVRAQEKLVALNVSGGQTAHVTHESREIPEMKK